MFWKCLLQSLRRCFIAGLLLTFNASTYVWRSVLENLLSFPHFLLMEQSAKFHMNIFQYMFAMEIWFSILTESIGLNQLNLSMTQWSLLFYQNIFCKAVPFKSLKYWNKSNYKLFNTFRQRVATKLAIKKRFYYFFIIIYFSLYCCLGFSGRVGFSSCRSISVSMAAARSYL